MAKAKKKTEAVSSEKKVLTEKQYLDVQTHIQERMDASRSQVIRGSLAEYEKSK